MSLVVVGMGELGTLLAGLLEAAGERVVAVRRGDPFDASLAPERVIVTVGEDDLAAVLASLPSAWRDRVVLVQNELAPEQWLAHGVVDPTVAVVWLEKKKGRAPKVVLPTPVAGPWAERLAVLLEGAGLAAHVIDRALLPAALLDKNVYILVSNLAGLAAPAGTTTAQLLELPMLETTSRVFADVVGIESARLGLPLDADTASAAMMRAFLADPDHVAAGRSAPARLRRTRARATALGLEAPALGALGA